MVALFLVILLSGIRCVLIIWRVSYVLKAYPTRRSRAPAVRIRDILVSWDKKGTALGQELLSYENLKMFPGNSMTAQSLIRLLFFSTTALSISETFQLNELLLIVWRVALLFQQI